jgi:hypothetical protein
MNLSRGGAMMIAGSLAAACDPMPMVQITNTTKAAVTVRFQPSAPKGYQLENSFDVKPGRSAQFPAGFTIDDHIVAVTGGCAYTFPLAAHNAVPAGYGTLTRFAFGSDMKLYVWNRKSPVQPKGWPLSAMSRVCR